MLGEKRPSSASTDVSPKTRKLLGPATFDATLCADARDPVSLQEIWRANGDGSREPADEIDLLFSYEEKHSDGRVFIRGFALDSVAQLIDRGERKHPVSGLPLPPEALQRAKLLIEHEGISADRVDFGNLHPEELHDEHMRFFALEVFQLLASIDVRVEERLFMSLSCERLSRLALETREMLEANLPGFLLEALKAEVGNRRPFLPFPKNSSTNALRQFVLREFRRIFTTTKSLVSEINAPGHLHLLAYVFVGALAAVCPEIRKNYEHSLVLGFDPTSEDVSQRSDEEQSSEASSSSSI